MELYESYVAGNLTKEEYLDKKKGIAEKESGYKEQLLELQEKIAEAEAQKAEEKIQG